MKNNVTTIISQLTEIEIEETRKSKLDELVYKLDQILKEKGIINLQFICTHNSRRSQFAQVWSHILANYYQLNLQSYSGGVEVTSVAKGVMDCLESFGIQYAKEGDENPRIRLNIGELPSIILFSKLYDDSENTTDEFVAVMVCSDADQNCPFIPTAVLRFSLPFSDPKKYDGSNQEESAYSKTFLKIGSELNYVFEKIAKNLS